MALSWARTRSTGTVSQSQMSQRYRANTGSITPDTVAGSKLGHQRPSRSM